MKKWKIFLIQHSHVDIGYTERQEKIEAYQSHFIQEAVEFALAQKEGKVPYRAPFKFTCESFWTIERYIERYGEAAKERLLEAMRMGSLELTAFYLHNAELLNRNNLTKSIGRSYQFAKENGLHLNTAVACDINGFPWALPDILSDHGISYLLTAINTHHGGAPFSKPLVPFYWEGPEGKKVLVWNGLTYHKANLLGLIPGFNHIGDTGIPGMTSAGGNRTVNITDLTYAKMKLMDMIRALKEGEYPYSFIPIMGSGLYTDNSPVTLEYLRIVDEWNQEFGDEIEIQTATVEEFFKYLEENVNEIPTYKGDWNDWWTDGTISTPAEVKSFRHAQRIQDVIEALNTDQYILKEELKAIEDKLFLFSEHTWGHSASKSHPWHFLVHQLEYRKSKHAYDADVLASRTLDKLLMHYGEGEFRVDRPFEYRVINPLDMKKKDVFLLPVDFWEVEHLGKGFKVLDQQGREYTYQVINTLRGTNVCVVAELEPKQVLDFKIITENAADDNQKVYALGEQSYENNYYVVAWNEKGIYSIIDKEKQVELLDQNYSLGQPFYQLFKNGERGAAAGFGYSSRTKPQDTLFEGRIKDVSIIEKGEIFVKLRVSYEVEGTQHYDFFVTLYHHIPVIDVNAYVTKTIQTDPEGLYIHFPFAVQKGQWKVEKQGILMTPGKDQLPDTCCDYYSVTHGTVLQNDQLGVGISLLDAPMIMFNGFNLWDFNKTIEATGTMYSWLTNNKWETNFKIHCGGLYDFRYRIEFGAALRDDQEAYEKIYSNSYEFLAIRK